MTFPWQPVRPPGSLYERLKLTRQKAAIRPAGPEREPPPGKAEQTERTAGIEAWIASPGAPPAE